MHKIFTSCLLLICSFSLFAQQPGDTVVVQTFSYSDPAPAGVYRGDFLFPPATEQYQKILMEYGLKCDPSTRADRFDCGEWDYLTYTYLWDSSGVYDSTQRIQQTYRYIDGGAPDSLESVITPTYTYYRDLQRTGQLPTQGSITYTSVDVVNDTMTVPFGDGTEHARKSQFLWTATDLQFLSGPADIAGLQFELGGPASGTQYHNLTISMQNSALDSLDPATPVSGGFTEVYRRTSNPFPVNNELVFYQPFNWDGTSSIVMEISYELQTTGGAATPVGVSSVTPTRAITTSRDDFGYLSFDGFRDRVDCGTAPNAAISGNNPRTIETWARVNAFNGNGGLFQAGLPGATDRDFSLRTTSTFEQFRVQLWGASDFDVTIPGSSEGWHHYAVTYDGNTVRLYFDGEVVGTQTANLVSGNGSLLIGRWQNARFNGDIDDFRVWDTALSQAEIKNWMSKSVTASHPSFANLLAYYPMRAGTGTQIVDYSGNDYHAEALGTPQWKFWRGDDLAGFDALTARPKVTFITSVPPGPAQVDTVWTMDSLANDVTQLIEFGNPGGDFIIMDDDPANPSIATDTLLLYDANNYSYTYLRDGTKYDSTFIPASTTYRPTNTSWFSNVVRFEIGRFITPYGIGLTLGPDGKTWYYDVTDYAPLFHDMVRLQSGNNQELHDLKFLMIKGEPAREVKRVQNIYDGNWSFTSIDNEVNAVPSDRRLDSDATSFRVKTRTSGHGFGGPGGTNCAEFCIRDHYVNIDGQERFRWTLWNECSFNPLPAQGGTWVYDRAGWCPGDIVNTYDWELTPFVNAGDTVNFDYDIDNNNRPTEGNWILRTQLVSYGDPLHQLDVAVEDVVAPNTKHAHGRWNPICGKPSIVIKNRGKDTLRSCTITYGVKDNGLPCYYEWTGALGFLEEETVELNLINWDGAGPGVGLKFFASVSNPNSVADGYDRNNYIESDFEIPPAYGNKFVIKLTTNQRSSENRWRIYNIDGIDVARRLFLAARRLHADTVELPDGCYLFVMEDDGNDGLDFFVNRAQIGSGSLLFEDEAGRVIQNFDPDLGGEVRHAFTVGYRLGQRDDQIYCSPVSVDQEIAPIGINLYPNPSTGQATLTLAESLEENGMVRIYDAMGRVMWQQAAFKGVDRVNIETDLPAGTYWVEVKTANTQGRKAWVVQ
ncbi:MAG: LamG-like jellyroll fold domain-containing protein [Bacteroidia bacterium]